MPFAPDVKTKMFIRCHRWCCLCLKQCGVNIEAAHIIDEAAGGSNQEDNGIPVCFDCHQEIGSYNDRHPRGNKIRPDELRARRDRVYTLVDEGKLGALAPANLPRLFERELRLKTAKSSTSNPTIAELLVALDGLDYRDWTDAYLILEDCAWENAFFQICQEKTRLYMAEYRDGATQLQYRAVKQICIEAAKMMCLSYLDRGIELLRYATEWRDITAMLAKVKKDAAQG
jgi:hypothetical protein